MKYYALISSLPDLSFESESSPLTREEFEQRATEYLTPADWGLLNLCRLKIDNRNLIALLEKRRPFQPGGIFTREELEEGIRFLDGLPDYMLAFLREKDEPSGQLLEHRLWERYLLFSGEQSPFLKHYGTFDRNLRNFITGINCVRYGGRIPEQLVGPPDFVAEAITTSHLPDFGLGRELPYAAQLLELLDTKRHLDWERYTDRLRFETLSELSRFHYFSVEQLLAYSLQLEIVERWSLLTEERGQERLEALLR